jgi:hypothetical protein
MLENSRLPRTPRPTLRDVEGGGGQSVSTRPQKVHSRTERASRLPVRISGRAVNAPGRRLTRTSRA